MNFLKKKAMNFLTLAEIAKVQAIKVLKTSNKNLKRKQIRPAHIFSEYHVVTSVIWQDLKAMVMV